MDNNTPDREESGGGRAHGAFRPLFFVALALLAAAAGVCVYLTGCQRESAGREARLEQRLAGLEQEVARQQALLEEGQAELDSRQALIDAQQAALEEAQAALDQAQDTIDFLAEYSFVGPDGVLPEYTQLYPDLYAPAYEGETIDGGRVVCLTFDDGPSANTDRILRILEQYGIKATFFVVGRTGERDQQRMRDIVAAGHTIAMHSWTHDYKKIYASVEAFLEEFDQLYHWIYEVTGVYPQVYRFPGGSLNGYDRKVYQEIVAEMTRRGFVYFDWNASAQDATVTPRLSADIAADCLRGIGRDLVVVLAHDSAARGTTVDALPAIIEGYLAAGYTFMALNPGVTQVTFGYPIPR